MAKPKHARLNNVVRHPHPHPPRFPSPAVLSALALIAATPTVVAASPLPTHPPAFLCPFIERDLIPQTSPTATSAPQPSQCSVVADRYVQGTDSLWRKTSAWTLYGSTVSAILTSHPSLQSQLVFSVLLQLDRKHFYHRIPTKFFSNPNAYLNSHHPQL